jgi:hypothetical protein
MTQDLGARLIRAGLLSRDELTRAVAAGRASGSSAVEALIADGFPEDTLAGFFVAGGDAKLATSAELGAVDVALVPRVPKELADAHCALPLRREGDVVVVALADPTDTAAREALTRALGAPVRAATAPRRVLREALEAAWTDAVDAEARIDVSVDLEGFFDDEPPVELVRRRTSLPSPTTPSLVPVRVASVAPSASDDEEMHVPLVRTKPATAPPSPAERIHIPTSAVPREAAELLRNAAPLHVPVGVDATVPPPVAEPAETRVAQPSVHAANARNPADLWSSLPPGPLRASRAPALASSTPPPGTGTLLGHPSPKAPEPPRVSGSSPSDDLDALLTAIRGAATRDEAVRLGCEASAPVGRCAVFLALKRDVLQGREVSGAGVSRAAVQRLWLPVKSASVFRDPVSNGTRYLGPYGTSSADGIFQAAIGSRGGNVLVLPVLVAGKAVAVLCTDGLHDGGGERIERIAQALGEAFERLILSKKA